MKKLTASRALAIFLGMKYAWLFVLLFSCGYIDAVTCVAHVVKGSPEYHQLRRQILSPQKPSQGQNAMDEILPGLYLGDLGAAYNVHKYPHITHVFSIIDKPKKIRANGIVWKGLKVSDSTKTLVICHFNKAFGFIESAKLGVLIHCRAGISRSATFVIAYIMWKFDVSCEEAHAYVRSKRPQILPNDSFWSQLKYYEIVKNGAR